MKAISRKEKYPKGNILIICVTLFSMLCLTVGYSILSEQLNINSTITLKPDKDVRISNVSNYVSIDGAYEVYNNSHTSETFSSNIGLPNLNSEISYTITITNYGQKAMEITSITPSVFNNDNMTYSLSGGNVGTVIEKDESTMLTITYMYKDNITVLPSSTVLGCVLDFTFMEYIPITDYVALGKILDLRGYEATNNSAWIDSRNNKTMTLYNAVYKDDQKLYDFSEVSAYGSLGEPAIPANGDFTLEAYIKTPTEFSNTNDDMAVVSQVSNTSNDSGRFKINIVVENNEANLIVFYHSQSPSTTVPVYFARSILTNTDYIIQIVRTGDLLKIYLNRELVKTQSYSSSNTISQGPLKIAYWNQNEAQYYNGGVYALRIYNRALNNQELVQNEDMDILNYTDNERNLKDFVLSNHLVASGEGLYSVSGKYVYKGTTLNNYIKFLGNNDLYRIVSFEADNTIKLLNQNIMENTPFDAEGNRIYDPATSTYCASASTASSDGTLFGCNYFGSTTDYLGLVVPKDSSIKTLLDNWYTTLTPNVKKYIVRHDFDMGIIRGNATYAQMETGVASLIHNDFVGLIGVKDIVDAAISPVSRLSTSINIQNYIVKMSSSTTGFWTMNGISDNTYDVWAVTFGTQLGAKKASRTHQKSGSNDAYYKLRPSFYIKGDLIVNGKGTYSNPFIIIREDI